MLSAALIALSVKNLTDIPGQQIALEAAVRLEEAVLLPENEGKPVIVNGIPEMIAPAYNEELTVGSIKAYRCKETYKQTGHTDDKMKRG